MGIFAVDDLVQPINTLMLGEITSITNANFLTIYVLDSEHISEKGMYKVFYANKVKKITIDEAKTLKSEARKKRLTTYSYSDNTLIAVGDYITYRRGGVSGGKSIQYALIKSINGNRKDAPINLEVFGPYGIYFTSIDSKDIIARISEKSGRRAKTYSLTSKNNSVPYGRFKQPNHTGFWNVFGADDNDGDYSDCASVVTTYSEYKFVTTKTITFRENNMQISEQILESLK